MEIPEAVWVAVGAIGMAIATKLVPATAKLASAMAERLRKQPLPPLNIAPPMKERPSPKPGKLSAGQRSEVQEMIDQAIEETLRPVINRFDEDTRWQNEILGALAKKVLTPEELADITIIGKQPHRKG